MKTVFLSLLLWASLAQCASSFLVKENVIFRRLTSITTTETKWTVSLILETDPYLTAITNLESKINYVKTIVNQAKPALSQSMSKHGIGKKTNLAWFSILMKALNESSNNCQDLKAQMERYRKMQTRTKRSLMPFVGSAFSYLFGSVSETDLEVINQNMHKLQRNQKSVIHVLEKSMSILNTSRIQISENRDKINQAILTIANLDQRVSKITNMIGKEITSLEIFIETYLRMDHAVKEINEQISIIKDSIHELGEKLNSLALGRLTPNVIMPRSLQAILVQIQSKLDPKRGLPEDPIKSLWTFYEFLTAKTVITEKRILVFISIPILMYSKEFEIYQAVNLPLPLCNNGSENQNGMTAHYDLEAHAIAINRERSKFIMLSDQEFNSCSKGVLTFCAITSPTYFTAKSSFCVISLFLGKNEEISSNCKTTVLTSANLPQANIVAKGQWAISARSSLQFSVVCPEREPKSVISKPPLSIIQLEENCEAVNEFLSFSSPKEQGNSVITESAPKSLFSTWEKGEFSVLKPIARNFGDLNKIRIPDKIQSMKQIPMDLLIDELKNANQFEIETKPRPTPIWVYLLCTTVALFIIIIISIAYWLIKGKRFRKAHIGKPTNFRHINKEESIQTAATTVKDVETVEELDVEFVRKFNM